MNLKLSDSTEPVMILAAVGAALGWGATFLVSHGVITGTQASTLVQSLAPSLAGVVALALGVLARRYVRPVVKDLGPLAAALTGTPEVAELLAELGLDPNGDPLPAAVPAGPPPDAAPVDTPDPVG